MKILLLFIIFIHVYSQCYVKENKTQICSSILRGIGIYPSIQCAMRNCLRKTIIRLLPNPQNNDSEISKVEIK
jgi:hypothetical protein